MEPLSCSNCCHNPLQLGPVGTAFGFCTRHRMTLLAPQLTTCGQLLRKDLLAPAAARERSIHARHYAPDVISLVAETGRTAAKAYVERPNGSFPPDAVIEEVVDYGATNKIATLAALHRIPGARAEVAMLTLGRGYFSNCIRNRGPWTAGMHLLWWTRLRLASDPFLEATDLREPITQPLERLVDLAKWHVVAQRLALLSDVALEARKAREPLGGLVTLASDAVVATTPGSARSLTAWLARRAPEIEAAFPESRYRKLHERLRGAIE